MKTAKKFMALMVVALFALLAVAVISATALPAHAETAAEEQAIAMVTEDEAAPAAEDTSEADATTGKAIAAGVAIGLACLGGAIAMGMAIAKSTEGIARQPEAAKNIRSSLMLGLVFVETVVIYALIVSILLIFVL